MGARPKDIELNDWEFRLVMGEFWESREIFLNSIFCVCNSAEKRLINYKVYLNDLNDLVLKGKCSACGSKAARYIETGENEESRENAVRLRAEKLRR